MRPGGLVLVTVTGPRAGDRAAAAGRPGAVRARGAGREALRAGRHERLRRLPSRRATSARSWRADSSWSNTPSAAPPTSARTRCCSAYPADRRGYSARNSSSSRLNSAGRSIIGTWPVSSKITLREPGISRSYRMRRPTGTIRSLRPQTISVGPLDLRQPVAEVVVEDRLERVQEPGLAAAARDLVAPAPAASSSGWRTIPYSINLRSRRRRTRLCAPREHAARDPIGRSGRAAWPRASSAVRTVITPGGRHEHQLLDAAGMADRHLRRDEAAHRVADDGRALDADLAEERVHEAGRSRGC